MAETRDLLLEIGTEEIPARFLPPAILQMESLAQAAFKENSLPYEEIKVYATPRRLVLHVLGLATVQPDLKIQQKGPSVKAAYDKDGNPTKALLGFCKSQQAEPKDLIEKEISGNIYLYVEKHLQGRHADEVLPDILINFIHKIYFPKP
ncbi:MAG: glycine--tRNA ligase subunit beta, partial [Clostridiales bacterium]